MEVTWIGRDRRVSKSLQRGLRAALVLTLMLGTAHGARAGQVELVSRVAADEVSDTRVQSAIDHHLPASVPGVGERERPLCDIHQFGHQPRPWPGRERSPLLVRVPS